MKHYEFVQLWETRERRAIDTDPPHDQHTFDEYLRLLHRSTMTHIKLHRSTRTHIKPPYTEEAIDEDSEEDVIEDVYDV